MKPLPFVLILFLCVACKRERPAPGVEPSPDLSIDLWNKSPDTIRHYLRGTWKCQSVKRRSSYGDVPYSILFYTYWTFTANDRVVHINDGLIGADTTIQWIMGTDAYSGEATYMMRFPDKSRQLRSYAVDGIYKDTLVVHENAAEPIFYSFTRSESQGKGISMTLYDKPLPFIQEQLAGKWKCAFTKGGFIANTVQSHNSYYWSFGAGNRVQVSLNGTSLSDTVIEWTKAKGAYTHGDSTYLMMFEDRQQVPWTLVVNGFFNDTLILNNQGSDASFYFLTRDSQ